MRIELNGNFHDHEIGVLINNRLRCFAHGACFRVDTGDIEDHPGHGNLPSRIDRMFTWEEIFAFSFQ